MKKWIIYGVLICSIVFNLIFITKACQQRKKFPPLNHHRMKPHKKESLRKFFKSKKNSLRQDVRKSNDCKDRLICRFLEEDLSQEDLLLLRDSLISITIERENKFIDCLIEYKTQEKEKEKEKEKE